MDPGQAFATHKDLLVVLATAGVVVPLMHRLRINPVLGFFVAGVALGPNGLGQFRWEFPLLRWTTISDVTGLAGIAEFGVVFLLFLIGLELSFQRLKTMRRLVFGLGGLQVLGTGIVITAVALQLGASIELAALMGAALSLSSTAIVIEVLARQRKLGTTAGRASFSVLLMQDLAVVPILLLIGILGIRENGSFVPELLKSLGLAVAGIATIYLIGLYVLRPIFRIVAATNSPELFMAATLFVAIGTGVLSTAAGMSMALGAFIAGLLLAETEYSRAIQTTIEPFKGLLLGVFFFSVGLGMDLSIVLGDPHAVLTVAVGLVVLKVLLFLPMARLFRLSWPAALESALLLAPCGEFAFVIFGVAAATGIVAREHAGTLTAIASLTMIAIPLLGLIGSTLARRLEAERGSEVPTEAPPEGSSGHAIVAGYGRVGQLVSELLAVHRVPYIAVDRSPALFSGDHRTRRDVYYGDIKQRGFLERCGIAQAQAVIVTVSDPAEIDAIVGAVRTIRPDIVIVSRARDAEHARHLYGLGVTDAVPETIEASLQLSEAALVGLGRPTGPVIATIHEKREEFRRILQQASGDKGRPTRGVRAARQVKAP